MLWRNEFENVISNINYNTMKEDLKKFWKDFCKYFKLFLKYLKQVHEDSSGNMSSKRVYGAIGFVTGLYLGFKGINPEVIKIVLIISAAMLGLDSITDIWKQNGNNLKDEIDK